MISLSQMLHSSTSTPQQPHDSLVVIKNNYQQITQIVSNSQSVFQKLYTKKESLLADFLEQSLDRMTKQLVVYNQITESQNIQKLCEERRKELQKQRMTLLKQFLKVSQSNINKKSKNNKLTQQITQIQGQLKRVKQINQYLSQQNMNLKPQLENLSLKQSVVVFPTQPITYVSPYSSQYFNTRKSQTPTVTRKNKKIQFTPFVQKLQQFKSTNNQVEITQNILNLPEVKMLMLRILNRKR